MAAYKLGSPGCCCPIGKTCFVVSQPLNCFPFRIEGATITVRAGSSSGAILFTCVTGSDGTCAACFEVTYAGSYYVSVTPPSSGFGSLFVPYTHTYVWGAGTRTQPLILSLPDGYKCCKGFPYLLPTGLAYTMVDSVYGSTTASDLGGSLNPSYPGCDPGCGGRGADSIHIEYTWGCSNDDSVFVLSVSFFLVNGCPSSSGTRSIVGPIYASSYADGMVQFTIPPGGSFWCSPATVTFYW